MRPTPRHLPGRLHCLATCNAMPTGKLTLKGCMLAGLFVVKYGYMDERSLCCMPLGAIGACGTLSSATSLLCAVQHALAMSMKVRSIPTPMLCCPETCGNRGVASAPTKGFQSLSHATRASGSSLSCLCSYPDSQTPEQYEAPRPNALGPLAAKFHAHVTGPKPAPHPPARLPRPTPTSPTRAPLQQKSLPRRKPSRWPRVQQTTRRAAMPEPEFSAANDGGGETVEGVDMDGKRSRVAHHTGDGDGDGKGDADREWGKRGRRSNVQTREQVAMATCKQGQKLAPAQAQGGAARGNLRRRRKQPARWNMSLSVWAPYPPCRQLHAPCLCASLPSHGS